MFDVKLPSGRNVGVKAPSFMDRMAAVKEFRAIQRDVGYTLEELMSANAITAINGNAVEDEWSMDPIMRMADWDNKDTQDYIEWFMTAFFPDDKLKERAQEEAKKRMSGGKSKKQAPANSSKPAEI